MNREHFSLEATLCIRVPTDASRFSDTGAMVNYSLLHTLIPARFPLPISLHPLSLSRSLTLKTIPSELGQKRAMSAVC